MFYLFKPLMTPDLDPDFDIDFNLSDEEDFCDKKEPENSHNVGVEDVTKEGEIIFKV